jgi:hypothetical protein
MSKSKVKSPTALKPRVFDIILPLFLCQSIPYLFTLLIAEDVVRLGKQKQYNSKDIDAYKGTVASVVQWGIIRAVNKIPDDCAKLDHHLS